MEKTNESIVRKKIISATRNLGRYKSLVEMAANGQPTYYNANEAVLNFYPEVRAAVLENTGGQRIKLSPGISTLPTFPEFIHLARNGLSTRELYVNYSAPFGTTSSVNALRKLESASLVEKDEILYPANGIYITAGGTEAINLALEYVKQIYPYGKIGVIGLSYYVFPFIADRLGIGYDIIITDPVKPSSKTRFLPTPEEVERSLSPETKVLVVTQPTNPTGEYYSRGEVEELVDIATKRDILILADNVFADLVYRPDNFATFEEVAFQEDELNRILTVRSYSKNYNIPGYRVGYLATSDPKIGAAMSFISERIKCCPANFTEKLINFVSLMQNIEVVRRRTPDRPVQELVEELQPRYDFGQGPNPIKAVESKYRQYKAFMENTLSFYGRSFDSITEILQDDMEAGNDKNAAFNTLVKIKGLQGINFFDFCVNLYMTCGIETQIGPCFGLGQKRWEDYLGFWLRVTYTLSPNELEKALRTLVIFRDIYQEQPDLFIKTGMSF